MKIKHFWQKLILLALVGWGSTVVIHGSKEWIRIAILACVVLEAAVYGALVGREN